MLPRNSKGQGVKLFHVRKMLKSQPVFSSEMLLFVQSLNDEMPTDFKQVPQLTIANRSEQSESALSEQVPKNTLSSDEHKSAFNQQPEWKQVLLPIDQRDHATTVVCVSEDSLSLFFAASVIANPLSGLFSDEVRTELALSFRRSVLEQAVNDPSILQSILSTKKLSAEMILDGSKLDLETTAFVLMLVLKVNCVEILSSDTSSEKQQAEEKEDQEPRNIQRLHLLLLNEKYINPHLQKPYSNCILFSRLNLEQGVAVAVLGANKYVPFDGIAVHIDSLSVKSYIPSLLSPMLLDEIRSLPSADAFSAKIKYFKFSQLEELAQKYDISSFRFDSKRKKTKNALTTELINKMFSC